MNGWPTTRSSPQESLLILIGGDETTRHTMSGGTGQLMPPPRSVGRAGQNDLSLLPERDRGDAALDVAGEEHGRDDHRRHRISRHAAASGREDDAAVRVGELRREPSSRTRTNFNIERDPNNHFAFGFGTHFCLGNQLARTRAVDHDTAGCCSGCRTCGSRPTNALPLRPANFVSGLEKMPVVFTPTKPVTN